LHLGDDVGKTDRTLRAKFSSVRWQRTCGRAPITGRSGQQYCGAKCADRRQQCQPAGKIPRFSAIRVSLRHYLLHQAISPADLVTHKWRRLIYENVDSALIRGNHFWMSLLLPKINPNAASRLFSDLYLFRECAAAVVSSSMLNDPGDKTAPKPPSCPKCAQPMRLIRRTPRFDGLPDLFTFECPICGMSHTEASS